MNTSPPPEQPHLDDEAISAALDGEGPAADRMHLVGCQRCSARRDALASARAVLAGPVEPLDEATRQRLLGQALVEANVVVPAAARRRWFERPALVGATAAVLVALVATVAMVSGGNGGDDDQSASPAAETLTAQDNNARALADSTFVGDLGDVSDPAALSALAGRDASDSAEESASPKAASKPGVDATGSGGGSSGRPVAPPAPQASSVPPASPAAGTDGQYSEELPYERQATMADAEHCASVLANGSGKGAKLSGTATGTLAIRGARQPVVVVAFTRAGQTTAYVTDLSCKVLRTYEL